MVLTPRAHPVVGRSRRIGRVFLVRSVEDVCDCSELVLAGVPHDQMLRRPFHGAFRCYQRTRYARGAVDETVRWVGDRALLRVFDGADLLECNRAAFALYNEIRTTLSGKVVDVVPGARSLLVVLAAGAEPSMALMSALARPVPGGAWGDPVLHEIRVRYGGDDGPDLGEVARLSDLDEREVVRLHTEPTYVVGFLGFSPGFPYLLGLPGRLATPRRATPRTRVPTGSVAIGGPYTGVYPRSTPGGWQVIGRTDVELFDAGRDPPALLAPGARVRFVAS